MVERVQRSEAVLCMRMATGSLLSGTVLPVVTFNAIYAPVPRSQQEGRNIDLPLDTDRY